MEAEASALASSPFEPTEPDHGSVDRSDLVRIGCVAAGLIAGRLGAWRPFFGFDALSLLAALAGGYPILRQATLALRRWRMTMELSMSIAVLAALAIGEFFTGAVIVLFVLVAEVLEGLTVGRGKSAIADLLPLLPEIAFLRDGTEIRRIVTAVLRPGDVIQIKPGSRIPVDGEVVRGHSFGALLRGGECRRRSFRLRFRGLLPG